jgi:hypothetical protein
MRGQLAATGQNVSEVLLFTINPADIGSAAIIDVIVMDLYSLV